jgi:hypothetical protein
MERNPLPSIERLRELLNYDPISGALTWRADRGHVVKAGAVAGCLIKRGYRVVRVDGVGYSAHRLCWKLHFGSEPPAEIDHKDQNKANNAITNLRAASHSQNTVYAPPNIRNSSGVTGVDWASHAGKWEARITKDYKRIRLGYFASKDAAIAARLKAAAELFGDFSPHRAA